jgi:phosphoheptose isomerase
MDDVETAVRNHIDELAGTLDGLRDQTATLARWGGVLAERLSDGRRLLTAGNGGSAAEAQHLSAELVGRFDRDRRPFSAIALHADTSALTAIGNDYGYDEVFARQVVAHALPGDVIVLLSTSGRSPNLLRAAAAARVVGATSWAITGPGPNPLADAVDEAVCLPGCTASVQEGHLVAIHVTCAAFEAALANRTAPVEIRRAS